MKRSVLIIIFLFFLNLLGSNGSKEGGFLDQDLTRYWNLAWEAYLNQEYQKAADLYLEGLQYDITNSSSIYNLACCYGLMGDAEKAAVYLEHSIRNGFNNYEHIISDPDFRSVKDSLVFKKVIDDLEIKIKQEKDNSIKEIWLETPSYAKSLIRLPLDFDSRKPYPLVVGLHGYGAKSEDFIKLWEDFAGREFIFICPESTYMVFFGKESGYSWVTWTEDEETDQLIDMKSEEYVVNAIEFMKENYKISSTYLMGFSQGCGLAYTTGIRNHDKIDGLMCFGGWLNKDAFTNEMFNSARDLRIFIAHGNNDKNVELKAAHQARDIFRESGYDIKYYEFEGGHIVPAEGLKAGQKWLGF